MDKKLFPLRGILLKEGLFIRDLKLLLTDSVYTKFVAVYELKNVQNVSRNTFNMFSNLKLISRDKGLHWNTLLLMLEVIFKKKEII